MPQESGSSLLANEARAQARVETRSRRSFDDSEVWAEMPASTRYLRRFVLLLGTDIPAIPHRAWKVDGGMIAQFMSAKMEEEFQQRAGSRDRRSEDKP